MIYLFYGSDGDKAREKGHALRDALLLKKQHAAHFALDTEHFSEERLLEYIGGQTLFETKALVSCNGLLSDPKISPIVLGKISDIAASPHIFIFIEKEIKKDILKKVEKVGEKVTEYEKKSLATPKSDFNVFSVADALGRRDRKELFVGIERGLHHGAAPEEIYGILFWQLKSIILASEFSEKESGLKGYPYKKAQSFSKNFDRGETKTLLNELVKSYHESRAGGVEIVHALEKFALSV